jgi:hypothetical protein
MTSKQKKILIGVAIVAGLASLYFGVRFVILYNAYSTDLNADQANQLITNATQNVADDDIIPDDATNNADASKGTDSSGDGSNESSGSDSDSDSSNQ